MFDVITGSAIDVMAGMQERSIQACVTSPPYFGMRDYGHAGQIGQEPTPKEFISNLVSVFDGVRRILSDDGLLWVNMGDCYAAQRGGTHQPAETLAGGKGGKTISGERVNRGRLDGYNPTRNASAIGYKHKDLMGMPWRLAIALQDAGWYLRQDIIWHKPNPMPESVRDRCTKAHEYIFMLAKSEKYFFDGQAIKERAVTGKKDELRNRRSVWSVNTKPFKGAHFATFPPELITPCILSSTRIGDTVIDPFAGSGTTGCVCEMTGRNSVMIELNPDYAEIARQRIAGQTRSLYYA